MCIHGLGVGHTIIDGLMFPYLFGGTVLFLLRYKIKNLCDRCKGNKDEIE